MNANLQVLRAHVGHVICLLLCLLFSGGAVAAADKDYRLSVGDVLHITVYEHPDLTTDARVSESGTINFPLVGETQLAGKNLREAERTIAQALTQGNYVKQAQVNILVSLYRGNQVSVLGQVLRPGRFPLDQSATVTDLLALAGGMLPTAADQIVLLRNDGAGQPERQTLDINELFENARAGVNVDVKDGDIVFVPRAPQFYIYGEVQRGGVYRLERNMTVAQGLSVGGGLSPRGTQNGIKILRANANGGMNTYDAKLADPLQANDVIYVKEALF